MDYLSEKCSQVKAGSFIAQIRKSMLFSARSAEKKLGFDKKRRKKVNKILFESEEV